MERLLNIEKCVAEELKTNYLARTNDNELIKLKNRPSFKSITRARRKVQAEHPELKDYQTSEIRKEEETKYKKFAKERTMEEL